jgi:hypothetical protein
MNLHVVLGLDMGYFEMRHAFCAVAVVESVADIEKPASSHQLEESAVDCVLT